MPRNALGHALGQNNIENFELLRGFITIQGIVGGVGCAICVKSLKVNDIQ